MRDLLIITPTRERRENAARLDEAVARTATAQTDLMFAVDEDDRSYDELVTVGPTSFVHGQRADCIRWTNRLAAEYGSRYRALASLGDDHVPVTEGWDSRLLAAIDDMGGIGIAYGNDTKQGARLPTAPVLSSAIVTALGWFMLPQMSHFYCDDCWRDLGLRAGCLRYLPDVIIEHKHPAFGTAPNDNVYAAAAPAMVSDGVAYHWYCNDPAGLTTDAAKIQALREAQ